MLNDFLLNEQFERIIERAVAKSGPIGAIGIQSHMHSGYCGHQELWDVCERFGKYGIPIHFSEVTILSGRDRLASDRLASDSEHTPEANRWHSTPEGEELQKQRVREMYRVLFSHPAVEAISWWDFTDKKAWMGAPAGLIDANMKPKPAYWELKPLKKGWTTKVNSATDQSGGIGVRGFRGDYRCSLVVDGQRLQGKFENSKKCEDEIVVKVQ